MEIRRATIDDAVFVGRLFNDYRVFYEQEANEEGAIAFIRERLERDESTIFIAVEDERCIGFTQLYPIFSSVGMQRAYILNDLYVHNDYRRLQIGERLMAAAFTFAEKQKARFITLETQKTNVNAQALYEKIGMSVDNEMLHYSKYF